MNNTLKRWNHHRKLKDLFASDDLIKKQKNIDSILIWGRREIPHRKICIVIPNYNRHDLFREALKSAVKQTVGIDCYNIVVADDSRDENEKQKALKIVEELDQGNIWYYRNEKQLGLFGNMNRGVVLSNSEWICFLHNDDILYSDAVERALKALEEIADENTASIYPVHDFIGSDGNILRTNEVRVTRPVYRWLMNEEHKKVKKREMAKLCLGDEERCVAPTCGAIFHKKHFISYGGYGEGYGAGDLLLLYGLCMKYNCYVINEAWGAFRWAENESLNKETISAYIEERRLIMDYFNRHYKKNIIQAIDLKIQYMSFYFGVIKKLLGTEDDIEVKKFLTKYLPMFLDESTSSFRSRIQKIRAFLIDKYLLLYNIKHSFKLPYKRRIL